MLTVQTVIIFGAQAKAEIEFGDHTQNNALQENLNMLISCEGILNYCDRASSYTLKLTMALVMDTS